MASFTFNTSDIILQFSTYCIVIYDFSMYRIGHWFEYIYQMLSYSLVRTALSFYDFSAGIA